MSTPGNFLMLQAGLLNALAHPARLEILEILREGEQCVCHIQAVLDQRQAFVSQHLNVLRQAGLVKNRKEGQRVYYQVCQPAVFELLNTARWILGAREQGLEATLAQASPISPRRPCPCPRCAPAPAAAPDLLPVTELSVNLTGK